MAKKRVSLYIGDKDINDYVIAFLIDYAFIGEIVDIQARGQKISKAVYVVERLREYLPDLIQVREIEIGTDFLGEGKLKREVSRICITVAKRKRVKRRKIKKRRKKKRRRPRLVVATSSCNINFFNEIKVFLTPWVEVDLRKDRKSYFSITDPDGETEEKELKHFSTEGLTEKFKPKKSGRYKVVTILATRKWGKIRRTAHFSAFPFLKVDGLKDSYLAKIEKLVCYVKASPGFYVNASLDGNALAIKEMKSRHTAKWHVYKLEHDPFKQAGQHVLKVGLKEVDIKRELNFQVTGKVALNLDEDFYRKHRKVRFYVTKDSEVRIRSAIVYPGRMKLKIQEDYLISDEKVHSGEYKIRLYGKRIHRGRYERKFILEGPRVDLVQGRLIALRVFAREEPRVKIVDAVEGKTEIIDLSLQEHKNGMKIYKGSHFCKGAEIEIYCEIAGYVWRETLGELRPKLFVLPSPFPKGKNIHFILQTSRIPTLAAEEGEGGAYYAFNGERRALVQNVEYPFLYFGTIKEKQEGLGSIIYEEVNISRSFKVKKTSLKKFSFFELLSSKENKLNVEPVSMVIDPYLKEILEFLLGTTNRRIFIFLPNLRHSIIAHHFLELGKIAMFGIYPEHYREKPAVNLESAVCPSCASKLGKYDEGLRCNKCSRKWRIRKTGTFPFIIFCPRCGKDLILVDLDMRKNRTCTDFGLFCENCGWFQDKIAFYDRDVLKHKRVAPRLYFVYFEPPGIPSKFGYNLSWLLDSLPWDGLCGSKILTNISRGFVAEDAWLMNRLTKNMRTLPDQVIGIFLWKNRAQDNNLRAFAHDHGMFYLALGDVQ